MRFCSKLGSYGEVFFVFEVVVCAVESPKVFLDFDLVLELDLFDGITWAVEFAIEGSGYYKEKSAMISIFISPTHPSEARKVWTAVFGEGLQQR